MELANSAHAQTKFETERAQLQSRLQELTAAQAQSKSALDRALAERKKAVEEAARLRMEVSKSASAREELSAQRAQLQQQVKTLSATQPWSEAELAQPGGKLLERIETLMQSLDDRRCEADALARARGAKLEETGQRLESESAERKRLEEKSAALEREEAALRLELERRASERAGAAAEGAGEVPGEGSDGRGTQSLNKALRKKLAEVRHVAQAGQTERAALMQQIQLQKEENQRLRQSLAGTANAGQATPDGQAKHRAGAPGQVIKSVQPGKLPGETQEGWAKRLFSSRKMKSDKP